MPQSARIRPALTEPIFGSAKSTSRTLAVRTYSGGWARICAGSIFPEARSFFSRARADRISLASRNARRRCSRDLPGTLAFALPADTRVSLGGRTSWALNLLALENGSRDGNACRLLLETRRAPWCRACRWPRKDQPRNASASRGRGCRGRECDLVSYRAGLRELW